MIDPVDTPSKLINSLVGLWERSEAFLWSIAIACGLVLAVLAAGWYLDLAPARETFVSYGLFVLIAFVVATVIACGRSYEGREPATLHLIGDDSQSYWGRSTSVDGKHATVFNFCMRATNISRKPIRIPVARLYRPRVGSKQEVAVATFDPHFNEYSDSASAMGPNGVRQIRFKFIIDKEIGNPGIPMKAVVSISDQRGRWHKYKFAQLRSGST